MIPRSSSFHDRRLLALFVAAEFGLLLLAGTLGPSAPRSVRTVRDADGAVVAFRDADPASQETILVRASADGTPKACAVVAARADGLARVGGSLFAFSSAGATELREHALERLGPDAFETAAFVDEPLGFDIGGAASNANAALVVGIDGAGRVHARRFDGIAFSSVALPLDGAVLATAVAAHGDGEFVVAAAQSDTIALLRVGTDATAAVLADRVAMAPAIALAFAADGDGIRLSAQSNDGEWWTVAFDAGLRQHDPRRIATGLERERLLAVAPGEERDVALWATSDDLVARALDGAASALPNWCGAYLASRPHFLHPMLLHFVLLLLGAWVLRPLERFDDAPILPLAPVLRRLGAFLVDFVLGTMVACVVYFTATGDAVRGFFLDRYDAVIAGGVVDPLTGSLFKDMQLAWVFVLTAYFAISESAFGCSIGKRLFRLRIVGTDGRTVAPGQALVRAMLLTFDLFLNLGLLGATVALLTRRRQRLGDLVARTVVIRR